MDSPLPPKYNKLDEAAQPCLGSSDDGSLEELLSWKAEPSPFRQFWRQHARAIIVHFVLISIYSLLVLGIILSYHRHEDGHNDKDLRRPYFYTPAREGVSYEIVTTNVNGNPYEGQFIGNPGTGVDDAWRNLLRATNLRVSHDELEQLNRTSLALADGSGDHWASMEVYHHLHCLSGFWTFQKAIRHYIAIDHYPEDTMKEMFIVEPGQVYPEHIEHCIEALRLYLICQPDISMWTYEWHDDHKFTPWANHEVAHECVNWDQLEDWAYRNSFSIHDELILWPNGTVWTP
ncbi:hypothetical protein MMC19_003565 [Ptychographa xylographoides]|nr:hypothetical protein [Ptychographa xylographoides]